LQLALTQVNCDKLSRRFSNMIPVYDVLAVRVAQVMVLHNPLGDLDEHLAQDSESTKVSPIDR